MGNKSLEIFVGLVVGTLGVVFLLYAIGWAQDWKLPGLATLKRHFSSSKTNVVSSTTTTAAAAANISIDSPATDEQGRQYCPDGWTIYSSDGHTYTCTRTTNSNIGQCGYSATFDNQWSSDGQGGKNSKKQWANTCHVQWTNPADGIPPNKAPNYYTRYCDANPDYACHGNCSYESYSPGKTTYAVYCNFSQGGFIELQNRGTFFKVHSKT